MKEIFIPTGIDRSSRVQKDFQKEYKPYNDIFGYHSFVRISSLTDEEIGTLYKGYNKSRIIAELDITSADLQELTIPIYEEHRLQDNYHFISYLGLKVVDLQDGKLNICSIEDFFRKVGFTKKEIKDEFQIYYDSIK